MSDTTSITFEDGNMFNEIKRIFGSKVISTNNLTMNILTSAIKETTKLTLNNLYISKIGGIEKFTYLTELSISNNAITDISKVKSLTNLTKLELYGNNYSDISALSTLTKLTYLDISRGQVSDEKKSESNSCLLNIQNLTNLKHLDVSHTYIVYLKGLQKLVNLEYLDLYDNGIKDLTYLATLTKLKTLKLGLNNHLGANNPLTGISSLNKLVELTELDLSDNRTPSLPANISNLTKLESLRLDNNSIKDISGLKNLTNLKKLILFYNSLGDASPLLSLTNLEELNLSNNWFWDLSVLYDTSSNQLKLPKLTKFYLDRVNLDAKANASLINYLSKRAREKTIEFDYKYSVYNTENLPHKDSNGNLYVTYEDFGARKDGKYDDFISMKYAHTYANEYGVEVRATAGSTYHIYNLYNDEVLCKTSVDWKGATIIIHDEKIEDYKANDKYLLMWQTYTEDDIITLTNPSFTVNKLTKKITSINEQLQKLKEKGYKQLYCKAVNNNKKIYIRYGMNANQGTPLQDYFIIDIDGNVLNDIQWDFNQLTEFTAYPIQNQNIQVKNAKFIHKVTEKHSETTYTRGSTGKWIYYKRGLYFKYSFNVEISNITHELEQDIMSGSYVGLIMLNTCANITIKDSNLYSRLYTIPGRSTYDLNIDRVVNFKMINVKGNDIFSSHRWSLSGSTFIKDVSWENVVTNTISGHEGIYNMKINNCEVGYFGLVALGKNKLDISNTKVYSNNFISLRDDYGSVWDGQINIINCTYFPTTYSKTFQYGFSFDSDQKMHDFGYDLKFPKVYVSNYVIDNSQLQHYDYPYFIYNDKYTKAKSITDVTKSYLSDTEIIIDSFKYVNTNFTVKRSLISYDKIDNFKNNMFISNLKFKINGCDITSDMYFNRNNYLVFDNDLYFTIDKNRHSNNTVCIYDNSTLRNCEQITQKKEYTFKENGDYRIEVNSIDIPYEYKGSLTYDFKINLKKNKEKIVNDVEGLGTFSIVFIIVLILALLGGIGFFFYRRKKRQNKIEGQMDTLVGMSNI